MISRSFFISLVFLLAVSPQSRAAEPVTQPVAPADHSASLWNAARAAFGNDQAVPKEPLPIRLDANGPYLILTTERAARDYIDAIAPDSLPARRPRMRRRLLNESRRR